MIKQLLLLADLMSAAAPVSYGQSARLTDFHSLAWLVYVGDHKVAEKWAAHTDYQWRRVDWLRDPQQLARPGLVRILSARVKMSGSYPCFQSHRYGQYAEVPGRATPEHRIYEDISLADKLGCIGSSQRIRLEQHWLGARRQWGKPGAALGIPKPHSLPTRSGAAVARY